MSKVSALRKCCLPRRLKLSRRLYLRARPRSFACHRSLFLIEIHVSVCCPGTMAFPRPPFGQENCDRVILVSSPTHLPRCLRDACSLWLDPQHQAPSRTQNRPSAGEHAEDAGTADHGRQDSRGRIDEDDGEEEEERIRRPTWLPLILASPSDTSYAGYGPSDVAIVEPPHRGDHDWGGGDRSAGASTDSAPIPGFPDNSGAGEGEAAEDDGLAARDASEAEETSTTSLLLLHDLVGLALRVRKSSNGVFRRELQELLRRYVDVEE